MEFFIFILIVIVVLIFIRSYFDKEYFQRNKYFKNESKQLNEKDVTNPNYYLPYKLKVTIMSEHERLLFSNLIIVLGPGYDIYPQVNLDKIFYVEYQKAYKYHLGWLRRINQKSVDFLVVKKETQSPVFAIELDDASHEKEDRIERDVFVQEIFKRNNFPLIRFNPGQYRVDELKIVLDKYINNF